LRLQDTEVHNKGCDVLAEDWVLGDLLDFCTTVWMAKEEESRYQVGRSSRCKLFGHQSNRFEQPRAGMKEAADTLLQFKRKFVHVGVDGDGREDRCRVRGIWSAQR